MALPEFTRRLVESKLDKYCKEKVPDAAKKQVQMIYKIRGNKVILYEKRRVYSGFNKWFEMPIAQFRYDAEATKWTLYCADRNNKWHIYEAIGSRINFDVLLKEVNNDSTGIFYG